MIDILKKDKADFIISLLRRNDIEDLRYRVFVEDEQGNVLTAYCYETDDYNEALKRARLYFLRLKEAGTERRIDVIIDKAAYNKCQDAIYLVDELNIDELRLDSNKFYNLLFGEFMSEARQNDKNIAFRNIVNKNKLNIYVEQEFLLYLSKRGAI